ncbi:MAG: peptidase [Gemmatimonadetes bacterium]|nr:peptidase [Gemmatimonadota bacterium]
MRRSSLLFALAASLPVAAAANAQTVKPVWPDEGPFKWAPRPTVTDITANDLRTRLYQFADDSMSGRRIGEPGNYKGTDYIAREFKRLGLKPAGDNGTYFQDLAFGPMGFDSTSARLVAGTASLGPKSNWIPLAPTALNGYAAKVDLANVPTVFAGRWGDSTAIDPSMLKGKIAVFTASPAAVGLGAPRPAVLLRCDSVPDKFGAAAAAKVEAAARDAAAANGGGRGAGAGGRAGGAGGVRDGRAQAGGAVGVLIIGLDSASAAIISGAFNGRMAMQPAQPFAGTFSAAAISRSAATTIFGKPVDQLTLGMAGLPVTESWSYDWHISKTPGRNVIAMLPGSDPSRAAEYVVVGAHNDHVGTNAASVDHDSLRAVNYVTRKQGNNDPSCRPTAEQQYQIDSLIARAHKIRPVRRDSIMNGADDDGSGTVVLLEIAEKFAKEKPARSIVFISHEGEEAGLLGSKWFVDHPTIPLKSIVAVHNMDMLGKGRADQVKFGGPASVQTLGSRRLSREFGDMIDSVNATRSEVMAIDKTWDVVANPMNRFCRSDQVNYVNKEIPTTYFSLGYALDYHQATDEPQYIEYDHTARLARFIHDVMLAIANRKDRLAITGPDVPYPSCGH